MSFNTELKTSLSKNAYEENDCELAQLYAVLQCGFSFVMKGKGSFILEFEAFSASVAKRVFGLIKENFAYSPVLAVVKVNSFGEKNLYRLRIEDADVCFEIVRFFNMSDEEGRIKPLRSIDETLLHSRKARQAYISGAMLCCGYVADPKKSYMAQFKFSGEKLAEDFLALLTEFDINAKKRYLKNDIIIYTQRADDVSALLALCGCYSSALDIQGGVTMKEMKNRTKRKVNFETANYNKTIDASYEQIQAIDKIQRTYGVAWLPEHLIRAAQLRADMPEASLRELAASASPPMSRYTLDKQLRKIVMIAKEIK